MAAASHPTSPLKTTPLLACHQALKARTMPFGGWEMPVQYQGITAEHQAVREHSGMFDISHMGKFLLQGVNLMEQLQPLVPSDLSVLKPGQAKYTVFLNESGGILDDLIVYDHGQTETGAQAITLIVNAATAPQDLDWLRQHLTLDAMTLEDVTAERVLLAVQGPEAVALLQTLTPVNLSQVSRYGHASGTILEQPAWFARTGYTGEDGFEIMVDAAVGPSLWQTLLDQGVQPCGLGARDTLRLEAAMALYGQDIDHTTTPLEAGLQWLVNWEKPHFLGREALLTQKEQGVSRILVGLQMEGRHIARHGYPVKERLESSNPMGVVTSGSISPTLGYPIALAYVPTALSQVGQTLAVDIRGKDYPAQVVKRPFYRRKK